MPTAIIVALLLAVPAAGCGGSDEPRTKTKTVTVSSGESDDDGSVAKAGARQRAIAGAKAAWQSAVDRKVDLSSGPCLGVVEDDWVADVAHRPRQPVDDLPRNRCPQYGTTAHHFVEVDERGRVIAVH